LSSFDGSPEGLFGSALQVLLGENVRE
jgi:hypothetical protein